MNKKKWYQKKGMHILFFVLMLICVIGVPIIINEVYKYGETIQKPYITMWGAGEVLSYYGAALSFLGTFILGVVAYKQNEHANKTNDKLAKLTEDLNDKNIKAEVRPALVINRVRTGYRGDLISTFVSRIQKDTTPEYIPEEAIRNINDSIKYFEEEIDGFYFTIKKNSLQFSNQLTSDQLEKIKEKIHVEKRDNKYDLIEENMLYSPYRIISVGNGPSVNVSLRLYREGKKGSNEVDVSSVPLSLKTNVDYMLGFYIEDAVGMMGKYTLEITFNDILNNKFIQTYNMILDEKGFKLEINTIQKEV